MNDSKNTAARAGQNEEKSSKIDDVCLSARHQQSLQTFGVSVIYRSTAQTRLFFSFPPKQVIALLVTGLLICKCFSEITRDAPLPAGLEGQRQEGRKKRICKSWILFAFLCPGSSRSHSLLSHTSLLLVFLDCFSPSTVLYQQSDFRIPAQSWLTSHLSGVKHKLFNITEQVT